MQLERKVSELTSSHVRGAYPLVEAAAPPGQNQDGNLCPVQYVPFTPNEVDLLKQKMPPVEAGGSAWLNQFLQQTTQLTLTLGDFRGVLSACIRPHMYQQVEEQAQIVDAPNGIPLQVYL